MSDYLSKKVLLVGAGLMAREYARVLNALQINYDVVGRSKSTSDEFRSIMNKEVAEGGIENFFRDANNKTGYTHAIVATGIDNLCISVIKLLENNISKILIEKPGGIDLPEINKIKDLSDKKQARVFIAYNRRFYASTLKAKEIISQDGGISSFHFEFTEWAHVIEPLKTPVEVKSKWFLANSSHVVDLAFYLGGNPMQMSSYKSGNLSWHSHSKYAGAGITDMGGLFSYHANWEAPGRWSLEIMTTKHRLYFKPMETLQVQDIGNVAVNPVEIDDVLDKTFKPGLFKQTEALLNNDFMSFCSINHQQNAMSWYNEMSGYESN
jgi:predicted dehydrogenase